MNRIRALAILGLTQTATKEQIKKSYRELCKKLHPDDNPSEEALKQYLLVQSAYEYLNVNELGMEAPTKPHIYGNTTSNYVRTGEVIGGWQVS